MGETSSSSSTSAHPCRIFSLAEIHAATKKFNDDLVVGQGGFGKVYKGRISGEEAGKLVAIKRLDSMSNQGELEFRAEINMLSKLRHCNLVSLIGYCDENKEMILVYEYMRNGTLYHHLHKSNAPLNWVTRLMITIGAGRGLDYLHTGVGTEHGVIHRDVKSSNILLDEKWAAMISDFGLSKIGPTNQLISYIDASVKGTFGYLDPEYFYTRKLTRKTDVYAFGVVLFELISGRLPVDDRNGEECSLVRWAQKCVKERKYDQLVDPTIKGTTSTKCLRRFAQIAYRCLHPVPKERPTMTEVVASLQALLVLQKKFNHSGGSLSILGFNLTVHKYFVSTIPNSIPNSEPNSGNFEDLLHSGDLVRLPLVTKVKILVGIAQKIVFLQNPMFNYQSWRKVSESELERCRILLDEDFTVKLSGYDSGHYRFGFPDIDNPSIVLECNLSGYKVIFAEVLTGKRIYSSSRVAKINRLFSECGKESLDRIAEICWEICNEVDSESKMLTMLKEHDKLIHERLEGWLSDPQN